MTEDDIVRLVQGTDCEEADTEQDSGPDREDSVPRVSFREGLSHAEVFLAALEQHEAFSSESKLYS